MSQDSKNVNVTTGELQHNVVVVDVDKKQHTKTEWKPEGKKQNVSNLIHESHRQQYECRVKEIMSDNNDDLWGSYEEGVLTVCDEV